MSQTGTTKNEASSPATAGKSKKLAGRSAPNWAPDDIQVLLEKVSYHLPRGQDEWTKVAESFNATKGTKFHFDRFKNKFQKLARTPKPTGAGVMPTIIKKAKEIQQLIEARTAQVDATEEADEAAEDGGEADELNEEEPEYVDQDDETILAADIPPASPHPLGQSKSNTNTPPKASVTPALASFGSGRASSFPASSFPTGASNLFGSGSFTSRRASSAFDSDSESSTRKRQRTSANNGQGTVEKMMLLMMQQQQQQQDAARAEAKERAAERAAEARRWEALMMMMVGKGKAEDKEKEKASAQQQQDAE